MDVATFDESVPSTFRQNLLLVRFPGYDRAEILRRLLEFEAGRVVPPGHLDRSSIGQ